MFSQTMYIVTGEIFLNFLDVFLPANKMNSIQFTKTVSLVVALFILQNTVTVGVEI